MAAMGRAFVLAALCAACLACAPRSLSIADATGSDTVIRTDLAAIQRRRLSEPAVQEVVKGVLLRLDDTQVRDRPGRHSSYYDYCGKQSLQRLVEGERDLRQPGGAGEVRLEVSEDETSGCRSRIYFALPDSQRVLGAPAYKLKVRNEIGEWSTFLGVSPSLRSAPHRRPFVAIQDSTMFVPAAVGYPLMLLQSSDSDGVVPEMLDLARRNIASYRRHDAYNFWPQRPPLTSDAKDFQVVCPHNLPLGLLGQVARRYLEEPERFAPITRNLRDNQRQGLRAWAEKVFDSRTNPYGADSVCNIPNDMDDTATAVAFELVYRRHGELAGVEDGLIEDAALDSFQRFRDLDRVREDGSDAWKGRDTGAFLTWLKRENGPVFTEPDLGVIPREANNVDCVVNANVLLALGLAGKTQMPGFGDAAHLMTRAITEHAWPECGLYYPQRMMFPYTLSRAYRDGGVRTPELTAALGTLMRDVMAGQAADGHFDGGADRSRDLSTALAVVALLNLGEHTARDAGIADGDYRQAISSGLSYLSADARKIRIRNADTFARRAAGDERHSQALTWDAGVFFSASFWGLVQWRSEAYTDAIVLEAFLRYALAFEKHEEGINGRYRVRLHEQSFDLDLAIPTASGT